jgi:hypothetical protein
VTRKLEHPQLPRFALLAATAIAPWKLDRETTVVEGTINGIDLGRRTIKCWDDEHGWFIQLPDPLCRKAAIDVGDTITLVLRLADTALPAELAELLSSNAVARKRWEAMTPAQQRMAREEVAAAKSAATRAKRARRLV